MLTLPPAPTAPALLSPFSVDDETIKITIQSDKKKATDDGKEKKEKCEEREKPTVTLLTGTYDPRSPRFGSLRQYTLASHGMFLDYFTGKGTTKAEIIGVGSNGGSFLRPRGSSPITPFLNVGWGIYHARGTNSETRLAWRLGMGVTTKVGFVAKLQLLDTKLKNGDLRGSSLVFGWRF